MKTLAPDFSVIDLMEAPGVRTILWTGQDAEWVEALADYAKVALDPSAEVTVTASPALSVERRAGGEMWTGPTFVVWAADTVRAVLVAFAYGHDGGFDDVLCVHAVMSRTPGKLDLPDDIDVQPLIEALESLLIRQAGCDQTANLLTVRAGARES